MDTKELLKARRDELIAKKTSIEASYAPIVEQYNALQAQIDPFLTKQRALGKEKQRIQEENKLAELDMEISAIAKSLGGLTLSGY